MSTILETRVIEEIQVFPQEQEVETPRKRKTPSEKIKEENLALGKIIQDFLKGDLDYQTQHLQQYEQARKRLFEINGGIFGSNMKRFRKHGINSRKLSQIISLAMIEATKDYNPEKSNYPIHALTYIKRYVYEELIEIASKTVRLTRNVGAKFHKFRLIRDALYFKLGRKPTNQEIQISYSQYYEGEKISSNETKALALSENRPSSISSGREGFEFERFIPAPYTPPAEALSKKENIEKALGLLNDPMILTEQEKKVLRMRFGIGYDQGHTLEEIGKDYGLTRERVRQIEAIALGKLQRKMPYE